MLIEILKKNDAYDESDLHGTVKRFYKKLDEALAAGVINEKNWCSLTELALMTFYGFTAHDLSARQNQICVFDYDGCIPESWWWPRFLSQPELIREYVEKFDQVKSSFFIAMARDHIGESYELYCYSILTDGTKILVCTGADQNNKTIVRIVADQPSDILKNVRVER